MDKVFAVPQDKLDAALRRTRLGSADIDAIKRAPSRGGTVHLTEAQIKRIGLLAIKASDWPIVK